MRLCCCYCLLLLNFMFYRDSKPKQRVAYFGEEIFKVIGESGEVLKSCGNGELISLFKFSI